MRAASMQHQAPLAATKSFVAAKGAFVCPEGFRFPHVRNAPLAEIDMV
jgi:hypothetical protein